MIHDTDTTRPQLILGDNTGGIEGPWELEQDLGLERRYWFYITGGPASDLSAVCRPPSAIPAVNAWQWDHIEDALLPLPLGASVTINYEYFDSPHGEQLIHWRLVMARIKEVRPDLKLAMYQVSPFKHPEHFEAMHEDDVDALCLTVFPSRWMHHNLDHIEELATAMRMSGVSAWWVDIPLTIATGWYPQEREGETTSDEVIEERLYHIARELKRMGIRNVTVWTGPPKPGVVRNMPKATRAAEIVTEVFADAPPNTAPVGSGVVS